MNTRIPARPWVRLLCFLSLAGTRVLATPDLVIPCPPQVGTNFFPGVFLQCRYTLENRGDTFASPSIPRVELRGAGALVTQNGTSIGLAAGGSYEAFTSIQIPANLPNGIYSIVVTADVNSTSGQINHGNDDSPAARFTIGPSADLIFAGFPTVEPSTVPAGGSFAVNYLLSNSRTTMADPSITHVRLEALSGQVLASYSYPVASLSVGAPRDETHNVPVPGSLPAATYRVIVWLDYTSFVVQSDRSNDVRDTTIQVIDPDFIPPAVTISAPADAQNFATPNIDVTGTATDDQTLELVEVSLNSGPFQMALGTSSWALAVTLAEGSNTLRARARDLAGNYSPIISVTVTHTPADTEAPGIAVNQPGDATSVTSPAIDAAGTATDNSAVTAVRWRVNGGAWQNATGTQSWTVAAIPLVLGTNLLEFEAGDAAGNTSPIVSRAITRERTQPFAITGTSVSGNDLTLAILSARGKQYRAWSSADLLLWTAGTDPVPGTGASLDITITSALASGLHHYFRVGEE